MCIRDRARHRPHTPPTARRGSGSPSGPDPQSAPRATGHRAPACTPTATTARAPGPGGPRVGSVDGKVPQWEPPVEVRLDVEVVGHQAAQAELLLGRALLVARRDERIE